MRLARIGTRRGADARRGQARPDMVDRIMDGVDPSEWGPAAEQQLCYEIKARMRRARARSRACS